MNSYLNKVSPKLLVSVVSRFALIVAVSSLSLARAEDMNMGGMGDDPPTAAMPADGAKPPMGPMKGKADKGGMGMMGKGMSGAATTSTIPPSELPAFAGSPGIYHVGATGFFLDRPELTSLTQQQRNSLEAIMMNSAKEQADYRLRIEEGERALWPLTGAEHPDAAAVDAKIREIEALRSQQRFGFIQAVGKAGTILTPAQRTQLASAIPPPAATAP